MAAWEFTVEKRYQIGAINSERGLQTYFLGRLFKEFTRAGMKRHVFVEPCFKDSQLQSRSPDIVICNARRVIGVIELKFLPRTQPKYAKDLRTLEWFAQESGTINLTNERYLGRPLPEREYAVAPDVLLCWAGIYRSPQVMMQRPDGLAPRRLFCMHAVTQKDQHPTIAFDDGGSP